MRIGIYEGSLSAYDTGIAQGMYGLDSNGDIAVPETIKERLWEESGNRVFSKIKDNFATEHSGVNPNSLNGIFNPFARAMWMRSRALAVTSNSEAKGMIAQTGIEVAGAYTGRFNMSNPNGISFKFLRNNNDKINGASISVGDGYGAKPRLDLHPLNHPSKKMNTLTLPESIKNSNLPIPHYHRGKGNNLRIHRPWELDKNGKRVW